MLHLEHISAGYGKKQVLFDISFAINQGEIVLLIGNNGSGKSTLLKTIYGLVPKWNNPSERTLGEIEFLGQDITHSRPSELISKGLMYIPQKDNCFDNLTVRENLDICGLSLGNRLLFDERYNKVLELFPNLKNLIKQMPMKLSGGERQLLTLAMAIMHEPQMILMDEPFSGLSPKNITFAKENIENLNKNEGITFLIIEHRIKEVFTFANNVIALKSGKVFSQMEMNETFDISKLNPVFV